MVFQNHKVLLGSIVVVCVLLYNLYLYTRSTNTYEAVASTRTEPILQTQRHSQVLTFKETDAEENRSKDIEDKPLPITHSTKQNSISSNGSQHGRYHGYIIALNYYEQLTMATGNLLQLQCFASMLNLSVVQPLMKESRLFTPLDKSKASTMLKLDDIFDMAKLRRHTKKRGYAPLVSWDEFIKYAQKTVILVQMKYPSLNYIKQTRKNGIEFPHPVSVNKDYERGCTYKVANKAFAELRSKNFTVSRNICYNFLTGDRVPMEVYLRDLANKGDSSNVTIIIDEWRGVGDNQRVLVDTKICTESDRYREFTQYSPMLLEDADSYVKKYLHDETSEDYLAVIARYEMTGLTQRLKSDSDPHAIIPHCLKVTLSEVEVMKKETGLKQIFLSVDIGKYGSKSFVRKNYFGYFKDMASFIAKAYNGKMDIEQWEKSFEDVARLLDSGYIANLQQLIVAKAKCVIFVGGGTFQRHTLHFYQDFHPNPAAMCINVVKGCTSSIRSFL